MAQREETYDYVITGGGSAASSPPASANPPDVHVLFLEAGPPTTTPTSTCPSASTA
ncbi:MAG: hypothetical protein R2748_17220 [Bryobacterales bacterium]